MDGISVPSRDINDKYCTYMFIIFTKTDARKVNKNVKKEKKQQSVTTWNVYEVLNPCISNWTVVVPCCTPVYIIYIDLVTVFTIRSAIITSRLTIIVPMYI